MSIRSTSPTQVLIIKSSISSKSSAPSEDNVKSWFGASEPEKNRVQTPRPTMLARKALTGHEDNQDSMELQAVAIPANHLDNVMPATESVKRS